MNITKNKYDFIQELLEKKNLSSFQKERLFKLVSKEIKNDTSSNEEILRRIRIIEEKIGEAPKFSEDNAEINNMNFLKSYLKPSSLYNFLLAYNSDVILKSTCHLIDNGELKTILEECNITTYDYGKHYKKIIEHFDNLENKYKEKFIDYKFIALIKAYLKGDVKWNKNISVNWNSTDLKDWAIKNPGIPPNLDHSLFEKYESIGFEFQEFEPIFKLLPSNKIMIFGDLVQYFKYLFHIRSDNSIKKICTEINNKKNWGKEIDFDYSGINEKVELFTNVEKLIEAYERLIKLILEVKEKNDLNKPQVLLTFCNHDENNVIFIIHHKNTTYEHTIKDATERFGQTYKNLISHQLNGLCDFNIEADFGNSEYANICIWDYKVWEEKKCYNKNIEKVDGVKYILTFRK